MSNHCPALQRERCIEPNTRLATTVSYPFHYPPRHIGQTIWLFIYPRISLSLAPVNQRVLPVMVPITTPTLMEARTTTMAKAMQRTLPQTPAEDQRSDEETSDESL